MSSSSSPMDYQKPVKVKSRWTQSCQMEMMMDESQSSLDMSDTITDISTSDFNESTDHSSELKSVKLRRSRRIGTNRTDYRQLHGLKTTKKKKSTTFKISNKKGKKKKEVLNTDDTNIEDQYNGNIFQESEIISLNPSIDWNNIKICQSSRKSKSVDLKENIENLSPKPTRRASLSWGFTFSSADKEVDNSILKMDKYISNEINCLNLNDSLLEVKSPSMNDRQLCVDDKSIYVENINENTSQISNCSVIDTINCKDVSRQRNNFCKISVNSTKLNKTTELNLQTIECDKEKLQQIINLVSPKLSLSEYENIRFSPNYNLRKIRSKSVDYTMEKTSSSMKRCKSYDEINKVGNNIVITFKLQKPQKNVSPKKRRQSKRIKPKNNCIEILDDIKIPEVDYNQVADEIYQEHKNQLNDARINDEAFDKKLKSTNFTLVNENVYRPNKQNLKLYPTSEIPALRKLKKRVISGDINDYCECTLSKEDIIEGITGCDDRCLNRLLKVECGSGCSLKSYCTNKQFQNKQFKRTNIIKTPNKGYGICAVEDIPKGVLINEYVGEVINYDEMCNRLRNKEYADLNYMVQLNSDEIIDSTFKGNLTRFLNHSCDPNSIGEKWHVLGQSRLGFFSTRHIEKGEEITFDYSFQIFGDGAQIVCHCGSSNCRGFISKESQITGLSSSEESDGTENRITLKPEGKQRILKKRTDYNNENKLRELGRQLTEIVKLKTGLKADQELATLNLNRLMVHITDSVSRLHVLKFIREHDMNKRLFMDFSGLSIIHNWMTSNENESFKLMILDILDELPITNRNTITKSKVLDVVAEWAKIPQDIRTKIESIEYPTVEIQNHNQEINNLLPNNNEIMNSLVEKARDLWKKWILLKMVFKIPKKTDQHKPNEEKNSRNLTENSNTSPMDISASDRKTFRISNKNINKVRNQQTVSFDRLKLRKEFELKAEQDRQKMFRKKVLDDWNEKDDGVVKKRYDQNSIHQQTLNYMKNDNSPLNYSNGIIKQSRWDCASEMTHISQNSTVNYNIQNPCLNFMSQQALQQPLVQFSQYSYTQSQIFTDHNLVNHSIYFNTPPPALPTNQPFITQPENSIELFSNKPELQNIESPDRSPTRLFLKSANTNVFNLINESLHKHYTSDKNSNNNNDTEHSSKLCRRSVQSGADLLGRIKVVTNSFKNQPSKLIKINYLKQINDKTKLQKIPLSDLQLKAVCNKSKRIIFINEQAGLTSNILGRDVMPTPKNIPLLGKNKFADIILDSLIKKTKLEKKNLIPENFILKNDTSDLITCDETDKEIELYKNMKPKIIKNVVAQVKTKNGLMAVVKRKWGIKLKGSNDTIPATKRNIMRKGSIHKSALKRQNNINVDGYLKKSKEKRVTFLIEGETSPIFPHSEVRPVNLNQNTIKQKPLMKCHPFEIRNDPKSIHQPSTSSSIHYDHLQIPNLEQSFETTNDQVIKPIVAKFKASRNSRRISLRDKSVDIEQLRNQRKHMIPVSMMSLSVDVLKLIPDNKREMKKVIDYYHSMATVIVKTLGSYAKKTCQQGRIRSDEDFKYLAKKINENVLLKELQLKKVDKLKISNSTKDKVAEYIRKYMSRFGEIYKRKPTKW